MKKLLTLLFSILISFNSYGEWTKLFGSDGEGVYIDNDTITKQDGYVYWLNLINSDKPDDGIMSVIVYFQGDCGITRIKFLSATSYKQPMGIEVDESKTQSNPECEYPTPDTVGGFMLDYVCDYIK